MYTQVNKLQTPTTADKPPCCNGTPAPEKASVQACLPSNRTATGTAVRMCSLHTHRRRAAARLLRGYVLYNCSLYGLVDE